MKGGGDGCEGGGGGCSQLSGQSHSPSVQVPSAESICESGRHCAKCLPAFLNCTAQGEAEASASNARAARARTGARFVGGGVRKRRRAGPRSSATRGSSRNGPLGAHPWRNARGRAVAAVEAAEKEEARRAKSWGTATLHCRRSGWRLQASGARAACMRPTAYSAFGSNRSSGGPGSSGSRGKSRNARSGRHGSGATAPPRGASVAARASATAAVATAATVAAAAAATSRGTATARCPGTCH